MRPVVLWIGLMIHLALHAQKPDSLAHVSLFTNASQNFDPSHSKLNLGLDLSWRTGALQVVVGRYYPLWYKSGVAAGFHCQLGGRLRLADELGLHVQVGAGKLTYAAFGTYDGSEIGGTFHADTLLTYRKTLADASILVDLRFQTNYRLWLQPFFGIGIRWKRTELADLVHGQEEVWNGSADVDDRRDYLGEAVVPVLRLGLCIGMRLGKRAKQ